MGNQLCKFDESQIESSKPPKVFKDTTTALMIRVAVIMTLFFMVLVLLFSYIAGGWVAKLFSPYYSFDLIPNLKGKVAVVTGSNTGIGKVTVRELVRKGAYVIATARDETRGIEAVQDIANEMKAIVGAGKVEFALLDLSSFKSVKKFANSYLRKHDNKPLDMLILNAGIMSTPFSLSADGFESQFAVNHLGHFLLTKLLMTKIKNSGTRIVSVSSLAHLNTYKNGVEFDQLMSNKSYASDKAYGQSKLANILFTNELAVRLKGTQATANSLHPGSIKTELSRHIMNNLGSYELILAPLIYLAELALMDADMGSLTQLYVATSPKLKGVTGKYFSPIAVESKTSTQAHNLKLQKNLWDVSEILISEIDLKKRTKRIAQILAA